LKTVDMEKKELVKKLRSLLSDIEELDISDPISPDEVCPVAKYDRVVEALESIIAEVEL